MTLERQLELTVNKILRTSWKKRKGYKVPTTLQVSLGEGAVNLVGTVLYADLVQSSELADEFQMRVAAKVIKCFLSSCSKLVTTHGGKVTSFDGDRIMAVFVGKTQNTAAAKVALKINYVVRNLIKPSIENHFTSFNETPFEIGHAVGIDTSEVLAVRAGQAGSNDLVWIGRAPNFAARLSEIRERGYTTYITEAVYRKLNKLAKYSEESNMWVRQSLEWLGEKRIIYRSSWTWKP